MSPEPAIAFSFIVAGAKLPDVAVTVIKPGVLGN